MKALLIIVIYSTLLSLSMSHKVQAERTASPSLLQSAPINFKQQIQPLLQTKCSPCHFPGGKMYASMPFDQASTILKIGPKMDKMAQRLSTDEMKTIRRFIDESDQQSK